MAKECVRGAHNKFEAKSNLRREVEWALGSTKEEKNQLTEKLKKSKHECQSALAGLKNAETQAEDQR